VQQVLGGGAEPAGGVGSRDLDLATLEMLVEDLGVLALVLGGLDEERGDLLVAFLLRDGRVEGVAVACLRLTGERLQQVLLGAGALDAHTVLPVMIRLTVTALHNDYEATKSNDTATGGRAQRETEKA
jgi:hypothetical protein